MVVRDMLESGGKTGELVEACATKVAAFGFHEVADEIRSDAVWIEDGRCRLLERSEIALSLEGTVVDMRNALDAIESLIRRLNR